MSGTFEKLDVPPTLVSFAVTTGETDEVVSPEFKAAGHKCVLIAPEYNENGLPDAKSLVAVFNEVTALMRSGKVHAAYTPGFGGIAEAVMKMSFGNSVGFAYDEGLTNKDIFGYNYGAFLLETDADCTAGRLIGKTTEKEAIAFADSEIALGELLKAYEDKLEPVYSCNIEQNAGKIENFSFTAETRPAPAIKIAKPRVLIPVFRHKLRIRFCKSD